jgi:hypothetical protein
MSQASKKVEPSPNDKLFAELEQQHGECGRLDVNGKMFVFRALSLEEFEDYHARARAADVQGPINREFAQIALVHPTLEELQALLRSKPALSLRISDKLTAMAGAEIEFTVKKG